MDRQAERNTPHTHKNTTTHHRFIQHLPHSLLYGCKTNQSSRPSHFQLCSDQYLSVSQEATTVNHNEICSTEKILSISYNERFRTCWRQHNTKMKSTAVFQGDKCWLAQAKEISNNCHLHLGKKTRRLLVKYLKYIILNLLVYYMHQCI